MGTFGMNVSIVFAQDIEPPYNGLRSSNINEYSSAQELIDARNNVPPPKGNVEPIHEYSDAEALKKEATRVAESKPKDPGPINCGFTIGVLGSGNIISCVAEISYVFLKGCSLLLQIIGMLFNIAINFTLNIGALIPKGGTNAGPLGLGGSTGIVFVGWSTIRDFVNVAFIFVLLFVAISIILQNDKYGLQKTVTKIVIAALLLNFSLFFTKVIIDLSNILALQFYTRILTAADKAFTAAGGEVSNTLDSGLSGGLRSAIGLESIWGGKFGTTQPQSAQEVANLAKGSGVALDPGTMISLCIFGGIFILVFSFVLFMATIQFVIRSIALILLMITSPIGFLGGAVPGLEGVSSDWWKRLKNNAIFAPAYMAVMYIACQMIFGNSNSITGGSNISELILNDNKRAAIGVAFWFVIVIGFLLAASVAARGFADKFGSSFSSKAGKWFSKGGFITTPLKYGGKGAKVATKYTGINAATRIGVGNAARKLSENKLVQRLASTPVLKQMGGQSLYNSIKGLQEAKIGGKSYKDVTEARVKRDKTTFERLGETTVRQRGHESDEDFLIRKTQEKNAAIRSQARFGKFDVTEEGLKDPTDPTGTRILTDADGNQIRQASLDMSPAMLEIYKREAGGTLGVGYRKARNEMLKQANPSNKKGNAEDIEKQIKDAEKELADAQADFERDENIYRTAAQRFFDDNQTEIEAGDHLLVDQYSKLKKSLKTHQTARKAEENNLKSLQRQLRQLENKDKDK